MMPTSENMNEILIDLCDDSNVFRRKTHSSIAKVVNEKDINVGHVLGSGAFSDVKIGKCDCLNYSNHSVDILLKLQKASNRSRNRDDETPFQKQTRPRENNYAVKVLRDDLTRSKHKLGAINLAVEAEFLSNISHPNIVTLYGVGEQPGESNFFIVLERLRSTLNEEIILWSEHTKYTKDKNTKEELLHQRIDVALQVSAGLKYLHEQNILFRDLKPDNIGLDTNGCVKIFDFGMAKELKEKALVGVDQFNATCKVGTPRYMAPEVYFGEPYGLPSDVYSFALVLWELMALEKIFADHGGGQENHVISVYVKKRRPKISRNWPKQIQSLIRSGWSHRAPHRPNIREVHSGLKGLL